MHMSHLYYAYLRAYSAVFFKQFDRHTLDFIVQIINRSDYHHRWHCIATASLMTAMPNTEELRENRQHFANEVKAKRIEMKLKEKHNKERERETAEWRREMKRSRDRRE